MKDFAKVFRADDIGQVLVTQGKDDDGDPALTFEADTKRGRISVSLGYESTEVAQKAFELVDEEIALEAVREAINDSPFTALIKGK